MASINLSVLGIDSSAQGVTVAGWVGTPQQGGWAPLSPSAAGPGTELGNSGHLCLFGLFVEEANIFAAVFLANVGCELLGAEHWNPLLTLPAPCSLIS